MFPPSFRSLRKKLHVDIPCLCLIVCYSCLTGCSSLQPCSLVVFTSSDLAKAPALYVMCAEIAVRIVHLLILFSCNNQSLLRLRDVHRHSYHGEENKTATIRILLLCKEATVCVGRTLRMCLSSLQVFIDCIYRDGPDGLITLVSCVESNSY